MVASRGIPSKFAFYLPPHYSKEIRKFEEGEKPTRNVWSLEEILNFVFPKQYQETYHKIAVDFLSLLMDELVIEGKQISAFLSSHNYSKATFYNRVLPKLKRIGMVKVERGLTKEGKPSKTLRVSLSKTFGNYMLKIADSWLALVDDARSRK